MIVRDFVPEQGICRAGRPIRIGAALVNNSETPLPVRLLLVLPAGAKLLGSEAKGEIVVDAARTCRTWWDIEMSDPGQHQYRLQVLSGGKAIASANLDLLFQPAVQITKMPYIPEPEPANTSVLVGAHNCPLWEADKPRMWDQVRKHPERTPALGFYSQESPEVADWETKWAVEHGVSFFLYCWYRASQGEPVKMNFSSAIHDALFKSRYGDKMKFSIMWENQHRGFAGVADQNDLMTNLLPFWIDNYFKRPNYLKIDNKPVLFIYRPEFLIQDLGSVENVAKAFDLMRAACKAAGFDGLYILGEYRGLDIKHLELMKQLGLDYTFAYCWGIPDSPTPDKAVATQMDWIRKTREMNVLPEVVTVSQAWSGWNDEGSIWKIPPAQFEGLLRQAKEYISTFPASELGSKILLLDNWNEWSEGHYIAPYREYGFGYLDAVRKVFSNVPEQHVDLIPDDIGMGPYDRPCVNWSRKQEELHDLAVEKVQKAGSQERGLVAWWAFDEGLSSPVALDYSGHRFGGALEKASRAAGVDGAALVCKGGCVTLPADPAFSPQKGMTVECWVRTDTPDQDNRWIVGNRRADIGFGIGLIGGCPCFNVPKDNWSHVLKAPNPLPLGRWVHVAGTYDNKALRIYIDGKEQGSLERGGSMGVSSAPLCLGSFAPDHPAYFTGLLDEVKLYDRPLSAEGIRSHAQRFLK